MGQKHNALQTLHDTITNKRQQRNWTKALEQVRPRRAWPPPPPSRAAAVHAGGAGTGARAPWRWGGGGARGGRRARGGAGDGLRAWASHPSALAPSPPHATRPSPQVMFNYIDLAVDMKQGRKCKDALINYRNACQQVNVASLEDVIKHLLDVASAKADAASKEAEAKLDSVEDLEADASPEEMMLSYVSGEKSKDRTDREMVTPWFKFLWETYRRVGGGGERAGRGCSSRWGAASGRGAARLVGCGGRAAQRASAPATRAGLHPDPAVPLLHAGTCWTSCATTRGWRRCTPWPPRAPFSSASCTAAPPSSAASATSCATTWPTCSSTATRAAATAQT